MYLKQAAIGLARRFCNSLQTQTLSPILYGTIRRDEHILTVLSPSKSKLLCQHGFGSHNSRQPKEFLVWMLLAGQAVFCANSNPVLAEDVSVERNTENNMQGASFNDLRKIEDGSMISNVHTSKWRVFTDIGRDYFLQGKLEDAERLFLSALQEAKEGFGERDAHVASALNNLAELYRVKKVYDRAEPFYVEAVKILEESFGSEDVRVAAALHNLGQFYLVQRKLEDARLCYERALKIKGRVLGHGHLDYADTMFHLGTVFHLEGKETDAETLIKDSIRILEEGGLGESMLCMRRSRYLAQIYIKANRRDEAEIIQRRILHAMELSKGWNSLDTIISAESLGLILQSVGNLNEAKDLFERCLEARKTIFSEDHIQVAANFLHLARVEMLNSNRIKTNISEAIAELDRAKDHLSHCIRIAEGVLYKSAKRGAKGHKDGVRVTRKDEHTALVILLQSLKTLGLLEINQQESPELKGEHSHTLGAENAFRQCISTYKEFATVGSISSSRDLKAEYLSCLKYLHNLISDSTTESSQKLRKADLQELKDEIKIVEGEFMHKGKHRT